MLNRIGRVNRDNIWYHSQLELLKEKKRQEYVLKQKAKLANYQSKVKSEAERIQVRVRSVVVVMCHVIASTMT